MVVDSNLPVELTSFVGREEELAQLTQLLADVRLLTLVGDGGVGKTRLALRLANEFVHVVVDGVWLVELTALQDPRFLAQDIATALRVREQPGEPVAVTLREALRTRDVLLVLDNCEHLVEACAELLHDLLRTCPRLRVVATSRERLALSAESTWRVRSLSVPDLRGAASANEIASCEAVRLFCVRARSALPQFALDDQNAAVVAQICRQLDGIPLALELAAARVRVLSPQQILERLDDCFRLLVGGGRMSPARHQTLRASVDWSYALLDEVERVLLRRLSIFVGGWTLEAAQAVCAGDGVDPGDVLDVLARLVDQSLVRAETLVGAARYHLLETVRQYALECLDAAGEADRVTQRHAAYYAELVEQVAPRLQVAATRAAGMARLEPDAANLRGALEYFRDTQPRALLRLTADLAPFWEIRGSMGEARRWLNVALSQTAEQAAEDADSDRVRVRALSWISHIAFRQGDAADARAFAEKGLRIARGLHDYPLMCRLLTSQGLAALLEDDPDPAEVALGEALRVAEQLADELDISLALTGLTELCLRKNDLRGARAFSERAVSLCERTGSQFDLCYCLGFRGMVEYFEGDPAAAAITLKQALVISRAVDNKLCTAGAIMALSGMAALLQQPARALRLAGAAEVLFAALQSRLPPIWQRKEHETLSLARQALGDHAAAAAWAEGQAMTPREAIDYALSVEPATAAPAAPAGPLSPREGEVALLVNQGCSNREIAEALVITERTVEAHITHVLTKLGLRSRAQVAVWVTRHGLAAKRPDLP